jgi:hypothetical protein
VPSTPDVISLEPLEIVAEALLVQARWTRALINRERPATGVVGQADGDHGRWRGHNGAALTE